MAITYPTTKDYDEIVAEGFWIADFYTSTCGPCKLIDKILSDIVLENPDINWAKCNLDNDWDMKDRYDVLGTPTLIFYLDGEEKGRMMGGFHTREEIMAEISRILYGE
ncbi:MAG: thioredoxin family protein [Oscillospiraceae bacterium]|nr:thioredoxin family protein [Oscillospiraceae bacterium]